jgi:rare lipoprotein A
MRKYILTAFTFLMHTVTNHSSVNMPKVIEESHILGPVNNDVDSTEYIKIDDVHSATWYNMHGAKMASGAKFHKDSLIAAYNHSKMNTYLRVTNVKNNKSIIVKVSDRMGSSRKNYIDLSKCAFDSIGDSRSGRINVIVEQIVNK